MGSPTDTAKVTKKVAIRNELQDKPISHSPLLADSLSSGESGMKTEAEAGRAEAPYAVERETASDNAKPRFGQRVLVLVIIVTKPSHAYVQCVRSCQGVSLKASKRVSSVAR